MLHTTVLVQMVVQGCWHYDSDLSCLPNMSPDDHTQLNAAVMRSKKKEQYGVDRIECLPQLMAVCAHESKFVEYTLKRSLTIEKSKEVSITVLLIFLCLCKFSYIYTFFSVGIYFCFCAYSVCFLVIFLS